MNQQDYLKAICMYLPYGVEAKAFGKIDIITAVDVVDNIVSFMNLDNALMKDVKLLLRPLSELNKGKNTNGEYITTNGLSSKLTHYGWELLYRGHYDIFGLIEKGYAITKQN